MRRCQISYVIREMLIKTTVRYHYLLISTAKIKNIDSVKCWQGCGVSELSSLSMGMYNNTAILNDSLTVTYKTKHTLTIWWILRRIWWPIIFFMTLYGHYILTSWKIVKTLKTREGFKHKRQCWTAIYFPSYEIKI